jgi:hypothetical protein
MTSRTGGPGSATTEDWSHITAGYDAINNLNWTVQHRRTTNQTVDGAQLGVFVRPQDDTRDAWLAICQGVEALEGTLRVPAPASRVTLARKAAEHSLWPHGDGADFDDESASYAAQQEEHEAELRRLEDG